MIPHVVQAPDAIEWDDAAFQAALERVTGEGVIEARGVHLSADQLAQLLAARGQRKLLYADFAGATFSGGAVFSGATVSGDARFAGATFSGDADFGGATFSGYADFGGATVSG